jgi:hypothetical protein
MSAVCLARVRGLTNKTSKLSSFNCSIQANDQQRHHRDWQLLHCRRMVAAWCTTDQHSLGILDAALEQATCMAQTALLRGTPSPRTHPTATDHVSCGLCLRHALGCQFTQVAAALYAALRIPCALAMSHEHHTLTGADGWKAQRLQILHTWWCSGGVGVWWGRGGAGRMRDRGAQCLCACLETCLETQAPKTKTV